MAGLLDRVRAEIHERLEASRAVVDEYERLRAAAAALGPMGDGSEPAGSARPAPSAARSRRRRPRAASASPAKRAPRGANREAVLRVISERPGVSASELAASSGVGRQVLYALLGRLVARGEVVKESLPGGATGYALPREGAAAPPADPPESSAAAAPESETPA